MTSDVLSLYEAENIFSQIGFLEEKDIELQKQMESLYEETILYAWLRARLQIATGIEIKRLNKQRTEEHDIIILKFKNILCYMKTQGYNTNCFEKLDTRKKLGDFSCYISYKLGMKGR